MRRATRWLTFSSTFPSYFLPSRSSFHFLQFQQDGAKAPRMYAARDPAAADAWRRQESLAAEQSAPLEARAAAAGPGRGGGVTR